MGLARGTSITLVTRALALLIGIASSVILARALGPAGRGEYALIVLIPALLQFVGGFGLEPSVTYLVAKRSHEAREIAFTLVVASLALGLLLVGVYALVTAVPAYLRYLQAAAVDPSLVWILIALLPLTLAAQSVVAAILGLERYRTYNVATLITPVANLALLLALVVALHLGVGTSPYCWRWSSCCTSAWPAPWSPPPPPESSAWPAPRSSCCACRPAAQATCRP